MNGRKLLKKWVPAIGLVLWIGVCVFASNLKLNTQKVIEFGNKGEPFYVIYSVSEDDEENVYILDGKKYLVRKFSKEGKELLNFGGRGEGPDMWMNPRRVFYSKEKGIIVTEMMNSASIFTTDGKIVKKINFAKKGMFFYVDYLGGGIFCGESQRLGPSRRMIFVDESLDIINSDLYTNKEGEVNLPGGMSYSLSYRETFPNISFSSYKGYGVIGQSDKYEFKLFDSKGMLVRVFSREVDAPKFTQKEREYFAEKIDNEEFPPQVQKEFKKMIPEKKMFFYTTKLTSKYLFVFRIKVDATTNNPPYPVDIFSINGEFLGELNVDSPPILITDRYMYFKEGSDEKDNDDIYIVKYTYELTQ